MSSWSGAHGRAPADLQLAIAEFWPEPLWDQAAAIAELESAWNPFALNDTTSATSPCGTRLEYRDGIWITAERSVGYFQINACVLPADWEWQRLYNTRHNAGTAHLKWNEAGGRWTPWYFSARRLGLL